MGCDIKVLVNNYVDGKLQTQEQTLLKNTDEDIDINRAVELITQLPKAERTKLAALFRAARVQALKESDVKKHEFISNTTIGELQDKYPDLKEAFPELEINENHTIVACNQIQLNGTKYFGRVISPSGSDIFFVNGFYGAQDLFNYLDQRQKIKKAIDNNTLREDLKEYQEELNSIVNKYNTTGEKLLLDYLDNKSRYKPFKDSNGNNIIPSKTLNNILCKIQDIYNSDVGKSDLELAIRSIKDTKHSNRFEYKLTMKNLYSVLSNYIQDMPSFQDFNNLSQEDLQQFLHNIFLFDPNLMKAKVSKVIGGETKEVVKEAIDKRIPQTEIKKKWKELQEQYNKQGIKLESLDKTIKNSPEQAIGLLKTALADLNPDITIQDGKIQIKYKTKEEVQQKESAKQLILSFPYSSLGEVYNFGYDSKYLFSPVKAEEGVDTDGMYHGVYIYKYYNPTTKVTHYAISRSIISPNSYSQTFSSLEAAKAKIDNWNATQKLREVGLYSIKMHPTTPRTSKIELKGVKEGQIVTTLDIQLPSISKFPEIFKQVLDGTLADFRKVFPDIEGIETLDTPEKAAAFVYLFTKGLKTAENKNTDINQLIKSNQKLGKEIVDQINKAETKSYLVEEMRGNIATLKYLENNGNKIDITGKFGDEAATKPTTASMEQAVKYFNDKFSIAINTMSQTELNDFGKQNNIDVKNARAFIYNGQIYINSSNANVSDVFHEMAHIFLGVLKAKYPDSYQAIITKYQQSPKFKNNFKYIDVTYNNFAMQDKLEECVVDMIADKMFQKQSLINEFKGQDFLEDFKFIFDNFPKNVTNPIAESGLAFDTFMKEGISKNYEAMKRNMKISNLIKDNIELGKIKEFGC